MFHATSEGDLSMSYMRQLVMTIHVNRMALGDIYKAQILTA